MSFISTKTINGRKRHYLEKSVRLLSGKVKKFSLYLKDYKPGQDLSSFEKKLNDKVELGVCDYASTYYETNPVFSKEQIKKLEYVRLEYQKIIKQVSKKQFEDILDRFTINFTYETNALEGNSLTLKDVTFIIKEGKIVQGRDVREIYETLNTRKAIEWVSTKKPKVTKATILKLHELLIKDTGVALGYKQFPNFLVGRGVQTTPPEKVAQEMDQLITWYNTESTLHPLQKAAEFHGRFEKIHPFEDGNGRTGRLLINLMLLHASYPPLIIRKTHRLSYFHALEAYDSGHKDKFFRFIINKYKKTYEHFFKVYVQYLKN